METAVGQYTAPASVTDNTCSNSLINSFDKMYYDFAAFSDVHSISLTPKLDQSTLIIISANSSSGFKIYIYIELITNKNSYS